MKVDQIFKPTSVSCSRKGKHGNPLVCRFFMFVSLQQKKKKEKKHVVDVKRKPLL